MKTIFKGASVFSMEVPDVKGIIADILIEEGIICAIDKNINTDGANIIDCTGKFIMPGLFDGHVHINSDEMHGLFIANGVTSVRNMWGFPLQKQWDKEVREGKRIGPYIYSTGPLIDGVESWKGCLFVRTVEEAIKVVDITVDEGWGYVKAYPSLPKDAMLALMIRAKERGIGVVGHLAYNVDPRTLADLGYYCVEHTGCLPSNIDDVRYLAKSGMWFCPTQMVENTLVVNVVGGESLEDIPHIEYVSPLHKKGWEEIIGRWRNNYAKGSPFYDSFKDPEEVPNRARVFMLYSDNVILGTDTPNPGVVPGFSIHSELEEMVYRYGMTPYKAIHSGTANAAKHLGIENKKGKLLKGMDADLLVLSKNPFENISNSRSIEYVVQGGRVFDKEALEGMKFDSKNRKEDEIISVY
ncbi:MAG: amidohydrolase family protein [Defluviitaleaceae bacterium]|nr:amidohydrolase family protein [Defluviitaleaceae bacterium]